MQQGFPSHLAVFYTYPVRIPIRGREVTEIEKTVLATATVSPEVVMIMIRWLFIPIC